MTLGIRKVQILWTHLFVKKWSKFCPKNKKCWCRSHFISFKIKTKSWPRKNECILSLVLVFLPLAYEFFAYLWWKICFGVGIQEYWVCLHLPLVLGWGQYKVWWPQRPFGGWKTLLQHLFSPKPLMIILLTNSSDVFTNLFHYFFPQIFLSLSSWKTNQISCSRHQNNPIYKFRIPNILFTCWINSRARHSEIYKLKSRNLF